MTQSSVFHRDLVSDLPVVVSGDGNYLIDDTGQRYLDACGGAAVSCLGHDNLSVREAIKSQVDKLRRDMQEHKEKQAKRKQKESS